MKAYKKYILILAAVIVIIALSMLFARTGFLQADKIDERDKNYWNYSKEGIQIGAEEITLQGSNETCWLMIPGYTSTPDELREWAVKIYEEFNETVRVPRIKGSGEYPSRLSNLTLDHWYIQIEDEYNKLDSNCGKINVLGQSFGGTLALRLAENKNINNVYISSVYIFPKSYWYLIFKTEFYNNVFADIVIYAKKTQIGQINSEEGKRKHISYWNFPLYPVKYSANFIDATKAELNKIHNPILIQQSKNDKTSSIDSSYFIYENVNSSNKQIAVFERSNHILPEDYDKDEALANIVKFEIETR